MRHLVTLSLVLFVVWVLWSGHYTTFLLSLGGASCLGVVWLIRKLDALDDESVPAGLWLPTMLYLPWLVWEIWKANVDVARIILSPSMPISPRLFTVEASGTDEITQVIYANSITLTPGTVSVRTHGNEITVHALTAAAAEGVMSGEMDRRVARLEGKR